jgi:hypothetical protein
MAELVPLHTLDIGGVRRGLRRRLEALGLREGWCVEGILGAEAPIDLVAADPEGAAVAVIVAAPGGELAAVASALAQRAFVAARIGDWKQLSPGLPLRSDAAARAIVVGEEFCPRAVAAAGAAGPGRIELWRGRALRNGGGIELVLERVARPPAGGAELDPAGARTDPRSRSLQSRFRTGLGDLDLGLSPEETREFD